MSYVPTASVLSPKPFKYLPLKLGKLNVSFKILVLYLKG